MLGENISRTRKEKGLTQEAFAAKLNVVRQTVSKWENGTAVPDADMLCRIADSLEVTVSSLLGREEENSSDDYKSLSNTLAQINEQLAARNRQSRKTMNIIWILLSVFIGLPLIMLLLSLIGFGAFSAQTDTMVVSYSTEEGIPSSSIGIIGGADGPTRIMVANSRSNTVLLVVYIVVAITIITLLVLYFTRKRR